MTHRNDYCRFRIALEDLRECAEVLEQRETVTGVEERAARRELIMLCEEVAKLKTLFDYELDGQEPPPKIGSAIEIKRTIDRWPDTYEKGRKGIVMLNGDDGLISVLLDPFDKNPVQVSWMMDELDSFWEHVEVLQ